MTDLLGVMLAWGDSTTVVQAESGERVSIALADIVSGKPVPPRPSVRLRVTADEAERRALQGWPAVEAVPLGSWVLRASSGFTARANSVLAMGSPGVSVDEALGVVREFYATRGLPPWAQVVVGSDEEVALVQRGWVSARPGEADSEFRLASVAAVSRALRRVGASGRRDPAGSVRSSGVTGGRDPAGSARSAGATGPGGLAGSARSAGATGPGGLVWSTSPTASSEWLANDARALAHPAAAHAVLEGPPEVAFVSVAAAGSPLVARGRVSLAGDSADHWAGITDVWVAPDHRRQGLALVVLSALVEWAAERGARTAYLQTRGDNPAAVALYAGLGFVTHHTYRYLRPGD